MSRSPSRSSRHAVGPEAWDQRSRATSLLLLAVGVTAGLALVAGARRGLGRPRSGRTSLEKRSVRDERRLLGPWREPTEEAELERRVLEAFRNDPIMRERPVDIGAIDAACIELTGWVDAPQEIAYARTLARGVPGVARVIDDLAVPKARSARVPRAD